MEHKPFVAKLTEWIGLPYHVTDVNQHVVTAAIVATVLMLAAFLAWTRFRNTDACLMPSRGLRITSIFEIIFESVLGFMEGMIGPDARNYLPLIATVFIFIFCCNLVGVIPGFSPPTSNVNTNLAIALCVFVYYNYVGIRKHGVFKYLRHMGGPVLWLAPLMFTIELVSHLVRPISLSVRLFGNMMGDHMVLEIFSNLIPLVIPIIFMGLTIFVAFIQAFVFSLLSTIYIALAVQVEGH